MPDLPAEGIRLQKVLAQAGIASRRACEQMIDEGRVEVNGIVVDRQGMRVDPFNDVIRVDGARIPAARRHLYIVLNKPRGVVSTMDDPQGRPDLSAYVPRKQRLFHVGRLDTDTEGVLILTNDGEFAHQLSHPSHEVPKTYAVECEGYLDNKAIKRLDKGLTLDDGFIKADRTKLISRTPTRSLIQITLHSGRNRVVRRMFDSIGHPVRHLVRISIGPVNVGQLPVGETRELSHEELGQLLDIIDSPATSGKQR